MLCCPSPVGRDLDFGVSQGLLQQAEAIDKALQTTSPFALRRPGLLRPASKHDGLLAGAMPVPHQRGLGAPEKRAEATTAVRAPGIIVNQSPYHTPFRLLALSRSFPQRLHLFCSKKRISGIHEVFVIGPKITNSPLVSKAGRILSENGPRGCKPGSAPSRPTLPTNTLC